MSYIYTSLKPHLCKDVIGIIEHMVRWEGDANNGIDKKIELHLGSRVWHVDEPRIFTHIKYHKEYEGEELHVEKKQEYLYCAKVFLDIERVLRKWRNPNVRNSKHMIVKVNENCYVYSKRIYLEAYIFVASSVETLFDSKRMTDEDKEYYFKLDDLS